jgi:hypothetical protein
VSAQHIPKCRCLSCQEKREAKWLEELREAYHVQDQMLAVICAVEWAATPTHMECPCCGGPRRGGGHADNCRLAAVLKSRRIA